MNKKILKKNTFMLKKKFVKFKIGFMFEIIRFLKKLYNSLFLISGKKNSECPIGYWSVFRGS